MAKWPSIRAGDLPRVNPLDSIHAALGWLLRSQDVNDDGGSSAYFSVETRRWAPSYPETTGYIIDTLIIAMITLDLDEATQLDIEQRIRRMADWLVSLQLPNGAFPGGLAGDPDPQPRLFNTGQIFGGLAILGIRWDDQKYLKAARRAADWICETQNADGTWSQYIYDRDCRTYYAHALKTLAFAALQKEFPNGERYAHTVRRFVDWALAHQRENAWIDCAGLYTLAMPAEYSVLHTIVYAIDGLLFTGVSLGYEPCIISAMRAAEVLMRRFEVDGVLWAEYDERWRPTANYICVTGCAQLGPVWAYCYQMTNDVRYLNALLKLNDCLRAVQPRSNAPEDIKGAFPGSIPIYAPYQPNQWPNWATKYALDSFLAEYCILKQLDDIDVHPMPQWPFYDETNDGEENAAR